MTPRQSQKALRHWVAILTWLRSSYGGLYEAVPYGAEWLGEDFVVCPALDGSLARSLGRV